MQLLVSRTTGARIRDYRLRVLMVDENTFGAQCGLSGMTIRRLEDAKHPTVHMRTAAAVAKRMDLGVPDLFRIKAG